MKLSNNKIQIFFDDRLNNLTQLVNLTTGENYIKITPQKSIFEILAIHKNTGEKIALLPLKGNYIKKNEKLEIIYDELIYKEQLVRVKVIVNVELENEEVHIWLNISNMEEDIDIVEILAPNLQGIYLGQDYTKNIIVYPHHAGEKTINPIEQYTSTRYREFWRAGTRIENGVYAREINYCGLASMTWMYYYNAENGLYIGSHDERFPVTGVRVETGGKASPWIGFSYRKHHKISYLQQWDSNKYCIGVSCQDWHWGAKKYRKWINKYLDIKPNPAYLKREYALNQCYNFKKDGLIHNRFEAIPKMYEKGMQYGIRHMFLASWNRKGFDCNYPEYYPDMDLGTAMDLCNGIDYINTHDGISTFYINARLFDKASDFYPSIGEKMAIKDENGKAREEQYGPVEFAVCCPSDEKWQKYLVDTAVFTAKAYGATGIYLDQLASAEPFACYDKTHTHENIGDFNNGYMDILKNLRQRLKEVNEDAYIMTENCGDIYGSYIWGNLTWNGTEYDECFNIFKYTFPEYTQVNMVNPRAWIKDNTEKEKWFYKDMERAVLLGSILWLGITSRFEENTYTTDNKALMEKLKNYMKQVLVFRKKLTDLIMDATYKDKTYILEIQEELDASVWEKDNEVIVIIGNRNEKRQSILKMEIPWIASKIGAYNIDLKEQPNMVIQQAQRINVTVNSDKLYFIRLEK